MLQISTQTIVSAPERQHDSDAAYDLRSTEDTTIYPMDRELLSTGITLAIPEGYCGLALPRSGLAIKSGITVANAPGLIDPGYRGEVKVALINLSGTPYRIERGDRIAQLLIVRFENANFNSARDLNGTDRGNNGFGSTGL